MGSLVFLNGEGGRPTNALIVRAKLLRKSISHWGSPALIPSLQKASLMLTVVKPTETLSLNNNPFIFGGIMKQKLKRFL